MALIVEVAAELILAFIISNRTVFYTPQKLPPQLFSIFFKGMAINIIFFKKFLGYSP
jgi:hypothetical protein